MEDYLLSISPIDGRYKNTTEDVRNYFSEYHLIKNRVITEIEWLKRLFSIKEIRTRVSNEEIVLLDKIVEKFDINEASRVKEIEQVTKHDVKAVEYYLDEKFKEKGIEKFNHLVHFACTSEDINNIAYGIMVKNLLEKVYIQNVDNLVKLLKEKANEYANIPMLSHTHGQNATPTTVGNFNAHVVSYPDVDWIKVSQEFVESFGLEYNLFTTQIEPHDTLCLMCSEIKLINNIILDFDSDMWMYISQNYFLQSNVNGEVGSSVMPHKINPINFENSMANLKMANGVIAVFCDNLQISRMQRDLSDSSLLRNIGSAIAYADIAIKQTIIGINKVKVNEAKLREELQNTPEVLAEAIQTILRKNEIENAYEMLKSLTRGKNISQEDIIDFIKILEINEDDKEKLMNLQSANYIGLAEELVKRLNKEI